VGALADGMSIVPTRRADRAGASSMKLIESDSISVSDAARGDMTQVQEEDHALTRPRWCFGHGADDQAGADGAALDGERVEQCADGAAASRTTAPGPLQAQASQAQASRRA